MTLGERVLLSYFFAGIKHGEFGFIEGVAHLAKSHPGRGFSKKRIAKDGQGF